MVVRNDAQKKYENLFSGTLEDFNLHYILLEEVSFDLKDASKLYHCIRRGKGEELAGSMRLPEKLDGEIPREEIDLVCFVNNVGIKQPNDEDFQSLLSGDQHGLPSIQKYSIVKGFGVWYTMSCDPGMTISLEDFRTIYGARLPEPLLWDMVRQLSLGLAVKHRQVAKYNDRASGAHPLILGHLSVDSIRLSTDPDHEEDFGFPRFVFTEFSMMMRNNNFIPFYDNDGDAMKNFKTAMIGDWAKLADIIHSAAHRRGFSSEDECVCPRRAKYSDHFEEVIDLLRDEDILRNNGKLQKLSDDLIETADAEMERHSGTKLPETVVKAFILDSPSAKSMKKLLLDEIPPGKETDELDWFKDSRNREVVEMADDSEDSFTTPHFPPLPPETERLLNAIDNGEIDNDFGRDSGEDWP